MEQVKVGVAVIISKGDGTFLLGDRKGSHGNRTWGFPGGHLEFGESFEECSKRETFEETGLKISNIKLLTITNDIFPKENKHYVTIFLTADYESGELEIKEPDKCKEWKWFDIWNFPENLFLPIQNLIKSKSLIWGKK